LATPATVHIFNFDFSVNAPVGRALKDTAGLSEGHLQGNDTHRADARFDVV
jgi:hypothetical protein